jgi:hypothetical protein
MSTPLDAKRNSKAWLAKGMLGITVLFATVGSACTTTEVPEAQGAQLPDELASTEHVQTYGVIEDDLEAYPWTGQRYEDPRFAAELDNSPLSGDGHKSMFGEDGGASSSVKMSKASKRSDKSKAKSKNGKSASSRKKKGSKSR